MMASLQDHILRVAKLLNHFMMHSFRVESSPSTFLTGAAVDENMKTGCWKAESTASYKIGATSSVQVGSKKNCGQSYAGVSELPL